MESSQTNSAFGNEQFRRRSLITEIRLRDGREAAKLLMGELPNVAGQVLLELDPNTFRAVVQQSHPPKRADLKSIFTSRLRFRPPKRKPLHLIERRVRIKAARHNRGST